MPWTVDDVPDQSGRTILVTGATSGLGRETARVLAGRGAHVVLATRDPARTGQVTAELSAAVPGARLEHLPVDLADLSSVRAAAARFLADHDRLDVLVANAGVMAPPERRTADGFELQLGVNHLGHYALTGLLLPVMTAVPGSRVVTVSSEGHRIGRMDFRDLNWDRGYARWPAYGRSKLANLLFTFELQRRLDNAGAQTVAVAAHPGYAATRLQSAGPGMDAGLLGRATVAVTRLTNALVAQSAAAGALPQLYAATAPDVPGGSYWGPHLRARGHPAPARPSRAAQSLGDARRLWAVSEELTGVSYDLPGRTGPADDLADYRGLHDHGHDDPPARAGDGGPAGDG